MDTMTPTDARINLSSILRRALKGEDIGIVIEGRIVALRPVGVVSRDYAEREYGLDSSQMKVTAKKLHEKAAKAHKAGKSRTFDGDIEALVAD